MGPIHGIQELPRWTPEGQSTSARSADLKPAAKPRCAGAGGLPRGARPLRAFDAALLAATIAVHASAEFVRLEQARGERHGAYHSAVHIDDCPPRFDEARDECVEPKGGRVCDLAARRGLGTRGGDGGGESAALGRPPPREGEAASDRVAALILAVEHDADAPTRDAAALIDSDPRGTPEALRLPRGRGTARVDSGPGPLFRGKQSDLLESFLTRPRLHAADRFRHAQEESARANLARSIAGFHGTG